MRESASKEVSNDDLIAETGIDRSNISKILSSLEKEKKIQRRYEQVGRAKFVWVSLTNSQSDKMTNSYAKSTNSHSKNKSFIGKDVVQEISENDLTNSQQNEITNSRDKLTNSHIDNQIILNNSSQQIRNKPNLTNSQSDKMTNSQNTSTPGSKILTVNSIFEKVIEYTGNKTGKGYTRINKILKSHDKNRNYQSNIIRDVIEILIEMGKVE